MNKKLAVIPALVLAGCTTALYGVSKTQSGVQFTNSNTSKTLTLSIDRITFPNNDVLLLACEGSTDPNAKCIQSTDIRIATPKYCFAFNGFEFAKRNNLLVIYFNHHNGETFFVPRDQQNYVAYGFMPGFGITRLIYTGNPITRGKSYIDLLPDSYSRNFDDGGKILDCE